MSTLSVIYKIGADITGLLAGVERGASATENLQSSFRDLKNEVTAAFTVTALVNFGREVLDAGDQIQKMADQTQLSIGEVQKLNYVAGQSGSSIESLIGAVQNLQVRLGDENTGAAGAMAKLGIEMESFSRLSTYQQMTTLADAIRNIHDPTEQASAAAAIFGKTWKEILPAIKSGMKDVGDQAPIMADETVKSLDRIGDASKRAHDQAVAWGGGLVVAIEAAGYALGNFLSKYSPENWGRTNEEILKAEIALNDKTGLAGAMSKLVHPTAQVGDALGKVALSGKQAAVVNEFLTATAKDSIAAHEQEAAALKKAAEAAERFRDSVHSLSEDANKLRVSFMPLMPEMSGRVNTLSDDFNVLDASVNEFHDGITIAGDEIATVTIPMFTTLPRVTAQMTDELNRAHEAAAKSDGVFAHLGDSLKGLWQGMSGGKGFSGLFENIGGGMIDQVGRLVTGGIASLVGLGVKGLGSLFGKLFDNPEKQINPLRQAFVDAAGGLGVLNQKAHEAGLTLDHLLDAKTPQQYEAAIKQLNDAFNFQDQAMQTLDATVEKYGITIDQLGPKFRQQKLDELAGGLIQDYQVLTAAGIDNVTVLEKMAPAVNDYIHTILTAGGTIPTQLQPTIEKLASMGLLTDLAGDKFEDMSKLTFAETLDAKFSTLIDKIGQLVDVITAKLGPAIANSIPENPFGGWHVPDLPGGRDVFDGAIPMADGGFGHASGPMLFSTRGNEDFAFSGEGRRFGGGGSGLDGDVVKTMLERIEYAITRRLPESINQGVSAALAKA
jgi:hypothetical protein